MTFDELREEVKACGLDHLPDNRVNRLVNLAYRRTYNKELWPWRLATTSGATPLAVTGTISQVIDSDGYQIPASSMENIENNGFVLTESGTASAWYLDADRKIATYPADSTTVTVRYYGKVSDMADGDTPDLPDEYHYLIVLDAVRRGKSENGEPDAAIQYASDYNELLADLKRDAFNEHVAGPLQLNDLTEAA